MHYVASDWLEKMKAVASISEAADVMSDHACVLGHDRDTALQLLALFVSRHLEHMDATLLACRATDGASVYPRLRLNRNAWQR